VNQGNEREMERRVRGSEGEKKEENDRKES